MNSNIYIWGAVALSLVVVGFGCDRFEGEESRERQLEREAASRPEKASLNVGAIHHFEGGAEAGTVSLELEGGTRLEIEEAYLVTSAVEVHACEPGRDEYEAPDGPLLNRLWPLIGGTAHAHVPDSSTRLGTPFVEDLLSKPGSAQIVGEIAPPLAAYCRVYAVLAPADRDVLNPTGLATDEITGHTLLVRGRHRAGPDAEWQPFEITSDLARPVELRALDPRTGDFPLVLDSPRASAMLLIDKIVRPSTFATAPDAEDAGETIVDRLTDTMRLHTFK